MREARGAGSALRPDDNPEVLRNGSRPTAADRAAGRLLPPARALKSVDGMAAIAEVAEAIDRVLAGGGAAPAAARQGDGPPQRSVVEQG